MKKIIRYIIRSKENERIDDTLDRHLNNFKKNIFKKPISISELRNLLIKMGIKNGDTLMIHSSWRKFYNYQGSPDDFIDTLLEIIGPTGTLIMPSFGSTNKYFDLTNTPSQAGVVSEVFRKKTGVSRSVCSHFSVAAIGDKTKTIIGEHHKSIFGFDHFSPYYKLSKYDAKIIMFGMGKFPKKLTMVHLLEYEYKDTFQYYHKYLTKTYQASVTDIDGNTIKKKMIEGIGGRLNKRNIRKVYSRLTKTGYSKISNLQIRVIDANETFNVLKEMTNEGITFLNPPGKNKDSFNKPERIEYEKKDN